jgi:hypothetical protein
MLDMATTAACGVISASRHGRSTPKAMQGAVEMSTPITRKQVHEARRVRNGQRARLTSPPPSPTRTFPRISLGNVGSADRGGRLVHRALHASVFARACVEG